MKMTNKTITANEGTKLTEKLNATYIGDHNYPLIEFEAHIWNYKDNRCEHFTIIIDDSKNTCTVPIKVYELAKQPELIERIGRELL